MLQKTALIECWYACRKSTWPNVSGALRVAGVRDVLAVLDAVARVVERRVRLELPESSAAAAVTVLNVEPGGYSPCVARFRSADVEPGQALGE